MVEFKKPIFDVPLEFELVFDTPKPCKNGASMFTVKSCETDEEGILFLKDKGIVEELTKLNTGTRVSLTEEGEVKVLNIPAKAVEQVQTTGGGTYQNLEKLSEQLVRIAQNAFCGIEGDGKVSAIQSFATSLFIYCSQKYGNVPLSESTDLIEEFSAEEKVSEEGEDNGGNNEQPF